MLRSVGKTVENAAFLTRKQDEMKIFGNTRIERLAVNVAMLVAGFAAGYWWATKTAYEIVREALSR